MSNQLPANQIVDDEITLRCPLCRLSRRVLRVPTDPPEATVVEIHCDGHPSADTERHEPMYFDANGYQLDAASEAS